MNITIKSLEPTAYTIRKINELNQNFAKGLRNGLYESGSEFVRHLRTKMFHDPKTGRIYDGIRASAPGEAPAVRTGKLQRSLDYTVRGSIQLEFGADTSYAEKLAGKGFAPRYLIRDTVEDKQKDTEQSLYDNIERNIF